MKIEAIDSQLAAARRFWRERPGPELPAPAGLALQLSVLAVRVDPAQVFQRTCWSALAAAAVVALVVQFGVRDAAAGGGNAAELWLEMEVES